MTTKLITRAEREARRGQPQAAPGDPKPIAQWRKKGCTTCKPIAVTIRPALDVELTQTQDKPS